MPLVRSFMFCGLLCAIAQVILDNTKLTPGHITSLFVVIGAGLDSFSIYDLIIKYVGGGALLPITSFGHSLTHGALAATNSHGFAGARILAQFIIIQTNSIRPCFPADGRMLFVCIFCLFFVYLHVQALPFRIGNAFLKPGFLLLGAPQPAQSRLLPLHQPADIGQMLIIHHGNQRKQQQRADDFARLQQIERRENHHGRQRHNNNIVNNQRKHDFRQQHQREHLFIVSQNQPADAGKALAAGKLHPRRENMPQHARAAGQYARKREHGEQPFGKLIRCIRFENIQQRADQSGKLAHNQRNIGRPCIAGTALADIKPTQATENIGWIHHPQKVPHCTAQSNAHCITCIQFILQPDQPHQSSLIFIPLR